MEFELRNSAGKNIVNVGFCSGLNERIQNWKQDMKTHFNETECQVGKKMLKLFTNLVNKFH